LALKDGVQIVVNGIDIFSALKACVKDRRPEPHRYRRHLPEKSTSFISFIMSLSTHACPSQSHSVRW